MNASFLKQDARMCVVGCSYTLKKTETIFQLHKLL